MNKALLIVGIIILVLVGVLKFWPDKKSVEVLSSAQPSAKTLNNYKDITYKIEGLDILLKNGSAETTPEPGSADATLTTEYFGNETRGDFNKDGTQDVAFILTQSGGGTGNFYYVVAALMTPNGYKGTNAILLGDRIAPQTTEFRNEEIIVNYATQGPGESYADVPTMGVSKHLKVEGSQLIEVSH